MSDVIFDPFDYLSILQSYRRDACAVDNIERQTELSPQLIVSAIAFLLLGIPDVRSCGIRDTLVFHPSSEASMGRRRLVKLIELGCQLMGA